MVIVDALATHLLCLRQVVQLLTTSLAVEDQKGVKPRKNWYRSNFGIKRSGIFYSVTYPKSTRICFGEKNVCPFIVTF